jgi:hypothetical protein
MYWGICAPVIVFSSWIGFGVGIMGEIDDTSKPHMNSPITSFVNIVGYTFIGVASGIFWPVAMPLLSVCAIYNRSGNTRKQICG